MSLVRRLSGPGAPGKLGLIECGEWIDRQRPRKVRRKMRQHERDPLSARNVEIRNGRVALAACGHRCAQLDRVRTCRCEQRALDTMNPRNHETVTEAHDELHAHRHATPDALDNADDVEPLRPQRHAIEQPNRPIAGIDFGFEDQRAVAVLDAVDEVLAEAGDAEDFLHDE